MKNNNNSTEEKEYSGVSIQKSSKEMTKSIFYNALQTYGTVPLNLIITMLFFRLVNPQLLGYSIYSLTIVQSCVIFLYWFPPSIYSVILYKIPKLIVNDELGKVKGLIQYFLKYRGLFAAITSIIFMITFYYLYLTTGFILFLLVVIISPIIFIIEIKNILYVFASAQKQFKEMTIMFFIEKIGTIIFYFLLFISNCDEIEKVKILTLLQVLIILLYYPHCFYYYFKNYKNITAEKISKEYIKEITKFAINYSISDSIDFIYVQYYALMLNVFGKPEFNSYDRICKTSKSYILNSTSLSTGVILADLEGTNQRDKMFNLYKNTMNFMSLFISLMIGMFYFLIPFYMTIVYPYQYEGISLIIQINLIISFFNFINVNYKDFYSITGHEKGFIRMKIISFFITNLLLFIGIYYWKFTGIILFNIISEFIYFLFNNMYPKKHAPEFKIPLINLIKNLISIIVIIILVEVIGLFLNKYILNLNFIENLINKTINIFAKLNMSYITYNIIELGLKFLLNIILFLIFSIFYIIIFKVIKKQDIQKIESLNISIPFKKYIFYFFYKILRE